VSSFLTALQHNVGYLHQERGPVITKCVCLLLLFTASSTHTCECRDGDNIWWPGNALPPCNVRWL